METQEHFKGRHVVLGSALLGLAALLLVITARAASPAAAEPHAGLNFTASIPAYPGCTTAQGNAQCFIPPGTRFTLNVTLGPLPTDISTYQGYDIKLQYSGLTSADNASTAMWPDCGFPATFYEPGIVNMACAVGLPPAGPSTYTGLVGTNDFTCSNSGAITLLHGDGATDLNQDIGVVASEVGPDETLNITCGSPPTATVPAPALGATGAGSLSQADDHQSMWLAFGLLLGLAGLSLVLMSWRFARSR